MSVTGSAAARYSLVPMYRVVETYYRQPVFDFYRASRNPFYSLTFELDAAPVKKFLDRHGYPVYLNLCYFFIRARQSLEDFRYRLLDDRIVLYDVVHPGLTYPAAGGLFSFVHFTYDPDVERFNRTARDVLPPPDAPASLETLEHTNYVFFTAIPGVPFTSFAHASDDPAHGAPRVAFGKFRRDGSRLLVPVGLQVNHLFIDGRALGELYEQVTALFANPVGVVAS